jgi:sulfate adenylyltransferase subunit 2
MNERMRKLESKSVYIMREAAAAFPKFGILWSGGKDSTALIHLAKTAFPEDVMKKIPIIHIATGYKFYETNVFLFDIKAKWHLNLMFANRFSSLEAAQCDAYPNKSKSVCCSLRKTMNFRRALYELDLDAAMVGIRRDEQEIRNKERFFSPRQTDGSWDYWNQPIEMQGWDLFVESIHDGEHMRIHPLLEWDEVDVWRYTKEYNLPVNPLYFSKDGKRMRSIGCQPCTSFIDSDAMTIDEIIKEIEELGGDERQGRAQDKEADMQRLRALGYM